MRDKDISTFSMSIQSPELILKKGLAELSLTHSRAQIKGFMTYLSDLKKWSKAYNLTGLKTDEEIIVKHFLDSLLYLEALPEGEISMMDVGSGAGFPGIPIKIMRPEIFVYLVEPSRKKASFLVHIIKTLGLDKIEVMEKRIEEVKSLSVDVALTRALFSIVEFYKKASPLVREGGRMILNKGPKVNEELKKTKNIKYELFPLKLPCSNMKRFMIAIEKDELDEAVNRPVIQNSDTTAVNTCFNIACRLRKAGCRGFEGCPGFKSKS